MIASSVRLEATTAVDAQRVESYSAEAVERLISMTFYEAGVELAVTMPRAIAVELHAQLGQVLTEPPTSPTVRAILERVYGPSR